MHTLREIKEVTKGKPVVKGNTRSIYNLKHNGEDRLVLKVLKCKEEFKLTLRNDRFKHIGDNKNKLESKLSKLDPFFNRYLARIFRYFYDGDKSYLIVEKLRPLNPSYEGETLEEYFKDRFMYAPFPLDILGTLADIYGLSRYKLNLAKNWGIDMCGELRLLSCCV